MNINSIKPKSSTLYVLNYLGMRHRSKESWTSSTQVAEFFSHIFMKKNRSGGSDASTVLYRLYKAGFVDRKQTTDGYLYAINSEGLMVPNRVRARLENSPHYAKKPKDDD